jgi:hypothetical protein
MSIKAGDVILWYLGSEHAPRIQGLHVARCLDCGDDWGVYASYGPDLIPKEQAVQVDKKHAKWLSVEKDLGDLFTCENELSF